MVIVSAIVGILIFLVMLYLVLSKKTSFGLRIAALVALGLMILAVIIGLIFIFSQKSSVVDGSFVLDAESKASQPESPGNPLLAIVLIAFLIAFFLVIFFYSMKERRKKK